MNNIFYSFLIRGSFLATILALSTQASFAAGARYIGDGDIADFSLEIHGNEAVLYLAHKPSNEPFTKAKVTLTPSKGEKSLSFTETQTPGVYKVDAKDVDLLGAQILLEGPNETDAIEVKPAGNNSEKSVKQTVNVPTSHVPSCLTNWWLVLGAFLLGGLGAIGFMLARKNKTTLLGITLLPLLGTTFFHPGEALAHGGHDHDSAGFESADLGNEINLSKKSQFLLGVKNVVAKKENLADVLTAYGHTISKPQLDAIMTAPQAGFFRASRELLLGRNVARGQVLGYLESTNRIPLITPVAGQVLEIDAVDGTRVDAGAKLFRVTDTSKIWVDAELFSSDLEKFKNATNAFVEIESNKVGIEAKIVGAMSTVSEETRTAKVFLELDNSSGDLMIGRFTTISFSLKAETMGIPVPQAAVLNHNGDNIVIIQTGPETFVPRQIALKPSSKPGIVVVTQGLNEGERVVASGNYLLLMKVN